MSKTAIKGTLRRRLTYIFSRSIKSLIYHIFTDKVFTLNFYHKAGPEIVCFLTQSVQLTLSSVHCAVDFAGVCYVK